MFVECTMCSSFPFHTGTCGLGVKPIRNIGMIGHDIYEYSFFGLILYKPCTESPDFDKESTHRTAPLQKVPRGNVMWLARYNALFLSCAPRLFDARLPFLNDAPGRKVRRFHVGSPEMLNRYSKSAMNRKSFWNRFKSETQKSGTLLTASPAPPKKNTEIYDGILLLWTQHGWIGWGPILCNTNNSATIKLYKLVG